MTSPLHEGGAHLSREPEPELPSWKLKQLQRERSGKKRKWIDLADEPEADSDRTLDLSQGPEGYTG